MGLTLVKADSYALDDLVRSGSMEAFNLVAASNSLHEPLHPKHVPMLGIGVSKSDPHLTNLTNPTKHPNRESFNPTLATGLHVQKLKLAGLCMKNRVQPTQLDSSSLQTKIQQGQAKSLWNPLRSSQIQRDPSKSSHHWSPLVLIWEKSPDSNQNRLNPWFPATGSGSASLPTESGGSVLNWT